MKYSKKRHFCILLFIGLSTFLNFLLSMDSEQGKVIFSGLAVVKLQNGLFAYVTRSKSFSSFCYTLNVVNSHGFETTKSVAVAREFFTEIVELKNGKLVCIMPSEKCVRIVNPETKKVEHSIYDLGMINAQTELNDGTIAFASWGIKILSQETGESVQKLPSSYDGLLVKSLAQFKNGEIIAGYSDGSLRVWDRESQNMRKFDDWHKGEISDIKILSSGLVATASDDKTVGIWDFMSGSLIKKLGGHTKSIKFLRALRQNRLASVDYLGTVKIWDVGTGECISTFTWGRAGADVFLELKNGLVATLGGNSSRCIKIWNPQTGECTKTLEGNESMVTSLIELDNGDLVSGSYDGTVRLWKCAW